MASHTPGRELAALETEVVQCRRCPRLVEWRERVALEKRAAYRNEEYWGKPVPGFGDPAARIAIVGLAPGAHGANRTGRMFTGDRSGEWLYGALHRAGLASRPDSISRDDGLELRGVWITAPVRCAPPNNRPTAGERDACFPFLRVEIGLLRPTLRVVVALGAFGWDASLRVLRELGCEVPRPRPRFGHGSEAWLPAGGGAAARRKTSSGKDAVGDGLVLLGSYHPSQQNTFTGRLTREMFDRVWARAVERANLG